MILIERRLRRCKQRRFSQIFLLKSVLVIAMILLSNLSFSQKINQEKLNVALEYLKSKSFQDGIEEVLVIQNDKVVFQGDSVLKKHNIYSCTKSFTSTILGLLIDEGKVKLDDYAWKYEPSLKELYPETTLRHFATMTSGYSAVGRSRWNDENSDWSYTPYTPESPHFQSGTHYEYWDEAQMMYGKVLTNILGKTMKSYLDKKLLSRLDFGDYKWTAEQKTESGIDINNGCSGIQINALQIAKMGLLYLKNGNWNGKQLLSEKWCQMATSQQVSAKIPVFEGERKNVGGSGSYGFNWWVNSVDGLSKMPDAPLKVAYMSGLNHNVCCIIPEWNMVIVRLGDDKNPPEGKHVIWNQFLKLVGESVIQK
jgi:CubicO group peptidase (beta-lactamase class C family)